ncbi:hypothetical protein M0812_15261 [Anaeramoeba flamelloides]|uniref:B box-type domain-containing protein n=1 Tax=Anaeramoeba flamelloides TaxID=1746091 RepID=A0AAV7ZER3_9EUKA|nr:hypothetical protein M0812_15261 [Anaeramoeba flamelloides]
MQKNKKLACEDCGSTEITVFCQTCNSFYCSECDIENHPTKKLKTKHKRTILQKDETNKEKKSEKICKKHNKVFEYYCTYDKEFICSQCFFERCKNHSDKTHSLKKNFFQKTFQEIPNEIRQKQKNILSCKAKVTENKQPNATISDILQKRKELISKFQNLQTNDLIFLDQKQAKEYKAYQNKIKQLQEQAEMIKSVQKYLVDYEKAIQSNDHFKILAYFQIIKKLLSKIENEKNVSDELVKTPKLSIDYETQIEPIIEEIRKIQINSPKQFGLAVTYQFPSTSCHLDQNFAFKVICLFEKPPKVVPVPNERICKTFDPKYISKKKMNLKKQRNLKRFKNLPRWNQETRRLHNLEKKQMKPIIPQLWITLPNGQSKIFSKFQQINQLNNYYEFKGSLTPKMEGIYKIHAITISDRYLSYPNGIDFKILPQRNQNEKKINNNKKKKNNNVLNLEKNKSNLHEFQISEVMKQTNCKTETIIEKLTLYDGDLAKTILSLI